jgi:hypothetical protein
MATAGTVPVRTVRDRIYPQIGWYPKSEYYPDFPKSFFVKGQINATLLMHEDFWRTSFPKRFSFDGHDVEIDELGYWEFEGVSYNGAPWLTEDGKLMGSVIDPTIKDQHRKMINPQAEIDYLNRMTNNPMVAAFQFPSRPHLKLNTKPCQHLSWAKRTQGQVCNICSSYTLEAAGKPIVVWTK